MFAQTLQQQQSKNIEQLQIFKALVLRHQVGEARALSLVQPFFELHQCLRMLESVPDHFTHFAKEFGFQERGQMQASAQKTQLRGAQLAAPAPERPLPATIERESPRLD